MTHFMITSPSFEQLGRIPVQNTCDGAEVSPRLDIAHAPARAKSVALIMEDIDAEEQPVTHWLVFDIPASVETLPEGDRRTGVCGRNDFQYAGYRGPCPPAHAREHRYSFTVVALDVETLALEPGATRREVELASAGHVLAQTKLIGRYQRGRAP